MTETVRRSFSTRFMSAVVGLAAFWLPTLLVAAPLVVHPAKVELADALARRQLLVSSDHGDVTVAATYTSSDAKIVTIAEHGYLIPQSVGRAQVVVRHGDQSATVDVNVSAFDVTRQVDFANDVVPLMSRYGCNAGGCHGKAMGQNGFKLSLLGFDPAFDYEAIVLKAKGRRIFPAAPERSLLLTKAVGDVPHGGGRRIEPGSEPYEVIRRWIVQGLPASSPDAPRVTRLIVEPETRLLKVNQTQQLSVQAEYSDGSRRDVTRSAEYGSNLDLVASADHQGLVKTTGGTGDAAIMVRYLGRVTVFRAIVPHGEPLKELPQFVRKNYVDELVAKKWMQLGIQPSPQADDATFLRRATLDVCGRLPTVEESRAYLADKGADKRERLVNRLLDSPDYASYFALRWSSILRNSKLAGADDASYAFHQWIKDMVAQNRPYDEFVRGVIAASGEWQEAPAINWFWQMRDDQLHQTTADTAQVFLGIRLQCARCHHHPYERWGQDDYYGLAGFFTRLGRKSFGQPPPYFSAARPTTSERNPLTNQVPEPKYPDGELANVSPEEDPRHALVDWLSKKENPFFAKTLVNRLWGHLFGRGLVDPVDDMRETNPPSNPELLDALARDFIEHKFDMRHMVRTMLLSNAYALDSAPTPQNETDQQNFARYYARRLIAEVLLDAVDQSCGTKTRFDRTGSEARAVELPHEGFGSYFLDTFDRPKRVSGCECERSSGATLGQVLLLSNSSEIENKIGDGNGLVARLLKEKRPPEEIVDTLYLAAFSRFPTGDERAKMHKYVASSPDPKVALEDVLWTLLNSKEFVFNH